jgi:hypothetical protein
MIRTTPSRLGSSLAVLVAVASLAAGADRTPAAPDDRAPGSVPDALIGPAVAEGEGAYVRTPDLGACDTLRPPARSKVSFHAFGKGVQIYRWNGAAWEFVNPQADLFADSRARKLVGTHFGGPTWQSVDGSKVVGTVTTRCTPNPNAIAWLLLDAAPSGKGVFERTKFIQRLNTVGGNAPSVPGRAVGDTARVPYTSDYFFYRAR